MTVRTGMANLIGQLRGMTDAGTADYTVAGETWWTDDQLQEMLDRNATWHNDVQLQEEIDYISNDPVYKRYHLPAAWMEEHTSGTTVWRLTNGLGSAFGTADYTVNYALREITMANDQDGSALYLTARSYSIYSAAADVWTRKASAYAARYDVSTDNHSLKRSQLVANARAQAVFYRNEAIAERVRRGQNMTRVTRVDVY